LVGSSAVGFAAFEEENARDQKLAGGGIDEIAVGVNGVFGEEFLFGGVPIGDRGIDTLVGIWIREIPGIVLTGFNENFHGRHVDDFITYIYGGLFIYVGSEVKFYWSEYISNNF